MRKLKSFSLSIFVLLSLVLAPMEEVKLGIGFCIFCKNLEQCLHLSRSSESSISGQEHFCLHTNIVNLALWVIIVFPIAWIAFVSAFTHPTWVFAMVYLSTLTWTMILITDPGSRLKHFSPYIVQGSWRHRWRWRLYPPRLTGWPRGWWKLAATENLEMRPSLKRGNLTLPGCPWSTRPKQRGKQRRRK